MSSADGHGRTSSYRSVPCTITHVHDRTNFEHDVWRSTTRHTIHYNSFNHSIDVPARGLRSNRVEVFCPHCGKNITVIARSDLAGTIMAISGIIALVIPVAGGALLGVINNGLTGFIAGLIGGGLFDVFLGLPISIGIMGDDFHVGGDHSIEAR